MSIVDEIKERLDIVEFIGSYVRLQKAGRNYKGLCPFHTEKTPSFFVFPATQTWHCFGACATGGDIFTFVMRQENMDFGEALRFLAERAGIDLHPLDQTRAKQRDELERLRKLNAAAAQYYHHILMDTPLGKAAKNYLAKRGVKPETMVTFQLGYAPDEWHALEEHLKSKGFTTEELLEAGLLSKNEKGNIYDRFRGRIMFPIRDQRGNIIGFGGRAMGDAVPKYMNTPETPLFDKSSALYGIDLARDAIRQTGQAIIVEGYMDVVIPHQCGVRNIVACMGTALTEAQVNILKRLTKKIIFALDPDAAGLRAVERGIEIAKQSMEHRVVPIPLASGLIHYEEQLAGEIRILTLPEGLDPDELILQDREHWDRLVAEALTVGEYFFQRTMEEVDLSTAKGKRAAVERFLPVIAAMDNPVERRHYLQQLARRVQVDERELFPEL